MFGNSDSPGVFEVAPLAPELLRQPALDRHRAGGTFLLLPKPQDLHLDLVVLLLQELRVRKDVSPQRGAVVRG